MPRDTPPPSAGVGHLLPPDWQIHPVTPGVRLRIVRPMPVLPATLQAELDHLWGAAQTRTGGRLFNGRVFSADHITADLVTGHWTEFRRIVAQMDQHHLFASLGLRPLAVNGVVHGPDGVVFGRRPADAVYQAGQWQLPPAGSVDDGAARADGSVDVRHAILAELAEELGLGPDAVCEPQPLALVEHAGSHVLDLGISLRTRLTAKQLRTEHARGANAEYATLEVVAAADLPEFLAALGRTLTPQAPVFLACVNALPPGPAW